MSFTYDTYRRAALLALAATVLATACKSRRQWSEERGEVAETWKPAPTAVRGVPPEALRGAVQARLDGDRPAGVTAAQWRRVHDLYTAYDGLPLWLEEDGTRDRAQALVSELAKAPTHALVVDSVALDTLRAALAAVHDAPSPSAEQLARADVLLSAAYVTLAQELLAGQVDPRSVSQDWHMDPQKVDVDSALAQRIRLQPLDRAIAQLKPADEDYDALREQLDHYRELVARGGWLTVPAGPKLKPGDTTAAARLTALARRMHAEDYLDDDQVTLVPAAEGDTAPPARAVYDDRLAGAVAEFQARHGIVVDSILGEQTVASMNVPAAYRAGQIAANLERFRWLPRTLGERYVLVNVPAFRLAAYDSGRRVLEMKVVVGAEYENRNTPVFADSMSTVVFRPYWNVTPTIALKEIVPKVAADPSYLDRHGYEVVRGQSDDAPVVDPSQLSVAGIESGRLRVRQRPGDENSLGYVKFLFPNDFNIYLHDTPQRDLFDRDVRAFSHGCIRVEHPDELAEYVLGWDPVRVQDAMMAGKDNQSVRLPHKLPVYIVYLTTYMRDGQLYFGNDLYDRDGALVKRVSAGALPGARTLQTLQELQQLVGG